VYFSFVAQINQATGGAVSLEVLPKRNYVPPTKIKVDIKSKLAICNQPIFPCAGVVSTLFVGDTFYGKLEINDSNFKTYVFQKPALLLASAN